MEDNGPGTHHFGGVSPDLDARVDVVETEDQRACLVRVGTLSNGDAPDWAGPFTAAPTRTEAIEMARKVMQSASLADDDSSIHPLAQAVYTQRPVFYSGITDETLQTDAERLLDGLPVAQGDLPAVFDIFTGRYLLESARQTPAVYVYTVGDAEHGFTPIHMTAADTGRWPGVTEGSGSGDGDPTPPLATVRDILPDTATTIPDGGIEVLVEGVLKQQPRDDVDEIILTDVEELERKEHGKSVGFSG